LGGTSPTRVIVLTGGAELQVPVIDFVRRLESDQNLELVGVFCEADLVGLRGVAVDLVRRRGLLAIPLLIQRWLRKLGRLILEPTLFVQRRHTRHQLESRLYFTSNLHAPESLDRIRSVRPQLGLVYGGPIIRPELFQLPSLGTLGIHHGMTPDYRGKKTTFWAMYNGESSIGVTIQSIGSGLDRGDVILEAKLPVGRAPLSVVSRRLERLGLDLYLQAIDLVRTGAANPIPQSEGSGTLYKDPTMTDLLVFWTRYLRRLFGSIRET
jgi:methionyl-tRNA formyltransferase